VLDIANGWRSRNLWLAMGLQDIRKRYRRSVLGPFWLTISMGVMISAMGLVWGIIFNQQMDEYLPYLCAGFVMWGFISTLMIEGATAFIAAEGMIKQLNAPLSIYVYGVVWRNFVILLHNIWILFLVQLWFGKLPGWVALMSIPGIALLALNGMWVGLLLGVLSARFRDIPQIVANIVQVMFFVTPIIWRPSMMPERAIILDVNPFYYALSIVRDPLLGTAPSVEHWLIMVAITICGWACALVVYSVYRWRLAYWV
jgi:ABC-type polysaccharide/polyol phosphate export permease